MKKRFFSQLPSWAALFFLLAISPVCSAANLTWSTTNGSWTTNANWNPQQQPGSGDGVFFYSSGNDYTSTLGANYTIFRLTVNNIGNRTIAPGGNNILTLSAFDGGGSPSAIQINAGAGAVLIQSALKLDPNDGDDNIISVENAAGLTLTQFATGTDGFIKEGNGTLFLNLSGNNTITNYTAIERGTMELTAGNLLQDWNMGIADSAGSNGTLNIQSGSMEVDGNFYVGYEGSGTVNVNGGNLTLANQVEIGTGNGTAAVNLNSGSLRQTAGWTSMTIGGGSGSGELNIAGGEFATAGFFSIEQNGTLNVSGGNATIGNPTDVNQGFQASGGNTVINLTGGTIASGRVVLSNGAAFNLGNGTSAGSAQILSIYTSQNDNGTLNLNHNSEISLDSNISNGIAINQIGSGTTTLTGGIDVTKNATISSGTLAFGGNSSSISIPSITNNSALVFASSSAGVFAGKISGTGSVTQNGTGMTFLGGNNTYTGHTLVQNGALSISSPQALYNGTASDWVPAKIKVESGATLAFGIGSNSSFSTNSVESLLGALASNATSTGGFQAGSFFGFNTQDAYGSALTPGNTVLEFGIADSSRGALGVSKIGNGMLTLNASNTYTGDTRVTGGSLSLGNGGSLASGNLSVTGSGSIFALDYANAGVTFANISVADGGQIQSSSGSVNFTNSAIVSSGTIAAPVGGTGSFRKTGNGTAVISDTLTHTGGTTIENGTLQIGAGSTSGTISGNVAILQNGTLGFNRSDSITASNAFSGNGAISKVGNNTLTLTGNSADFEGATTISAGTLQIGNGGSTGSLGGNITASTGSTLAYNSSSEVALDALSGNGTLIQAGNGTLVVSSDSTGFTGSTRIQSGTLQLGNGGTTGGLSGNITNNATLAINRSDDFTFSTNSTGTGKLLKLGTNTVTVNRTQSNTGGTVIDSGTLALASNNILATTGNLVVNELGTFNLGTNNQTLSTVTLNGGNITGTGKITSNSSFAIQGGSVSALLAGSAGLVKSGTSSFAITGNNLYSGKTVVADGIVFFDTTNATRTAAQALGTNADFDLGAELSTSGTLNYTGAAATFAKNIKALGAGNNTIQNSGSGLLTLTGTLTKNGTILVLAGGEGGIQVNGVIAGSAENSDLVLNGGNITLNATNTYNGPTYLNNGATLTLSVANALPGDLIIDASSSVAFGANQTIEALSGVAGSTIDIGSYTLTMGSNGTDSLYEGGIEGSGKVVKTGTNAITLSGTNTYNGTTTINGGVLVFGTPASLYNGDNSTWTGSKITVNSGGAIALAVGANGSFTGNQVTEIFDSLSSNSTPGGILAGGSFGLDVTGEMEMQQVASNRQGGGAIGFVKLGDGTLTITGNNTYTGPTSIRGGTLALGLSDALVSTGNLTIQSGTLALGSNNQTLRNVTLTSGTISGSGAILTASNFAVQSGVVSANLAGNATFQKTTSGTVMLSGLNSYTGSTTLSAGTLNFLTASALYSANSARWTSGNITASSGSTMAFGVGGTYAFSSSNIDTLITNLTQSQSTSGGIVAGASIGLDTSGGDALLSTIFKDRTGTGAGAIGLVKLGQGTLTLTGNSSNTGGIFIESGTLAGNSNSLKGNITNNATLHLGSYGSYMAQISGMGSLITSDTLTFLGNATMTGGTTIQSGTLTIGGYLPNSIGYNSAYYRVGSITGHIAVEGSLVFDLSSLAGTRAYNGTISGNGSLSTTFTYPHYPSGANGTLRLTGNNTFTGGTSVSVGTLDISGGTLASTGSVTVSDVGTLAIGSSNQTIGNFTIGYGSVTGNGSLTAQSYNLQHGSIAPGLAGTAGLEKNAYGYSSQSISYDNGRVYLTGNNTSSGNITINSGILSFDNVQSLYSGNNASWSKEKIRVSANATLSLATGIGTATSGFNNAQITEIFSNLTQNGTGGLAANSKIGLNTISDFTLTTTITDRPDGGVLGLDKIGDGNLILDANNTFTGELSIFEGTVTLGRNNALRTNSDLVVDSKSSASYGFNVGNYSQQFVDITLKEGLLAGGSGAFIATGNYTMIKGNATANLSGNASLIKTNIYGFSYNVSEPEIVFLSGNNSYTGRTTVDGSEWYGTQSPSPSSNPGAPTKDNAKLQFQTVGSLYGGNATLWTPENISVDSYGILSLRTGSAGFNGTQVSTIIQNLITANRSTGGFLDKSVLGIDTNGENLVINDAIGDTTGLTSGGGAVGLVKYGSGTLTLNGNSTRSFSTSVTGGNLVLSSNATLSSASANLLVDNAVLNIASTNQTVRKVTVTSGSIIGSGTLTSSAEGFVFGTANITANLAGAVGATIDQGTTILSGNNTYTGNTTMGYSATLSLANVNALSGSTLVILSNYSGPLQLSVGGTNTYNFGGLSGTGNLTMGSNSLSIGANSQNTAYSGSLSGTGSVSKVGNGTFTLSGNNSYTGGTTVSNGTLAIGTGGTDGSVTGNITNNAALVFNRSDNSTYSGIVSGTGSVTKNGFSLLTLSGNNTYTGNTTINTGTLGLDGTLASTAISIASGAGLNTSGGVSANAAVANSGNFTVNAADTIGSLSGSGNTILNAALSIGALGTADEISGTITGNASLTKAGNGTLSLTGSATNAGGLVISSGTVSIGNGGTTGSVTGNITNNAALVFNRSNDSTISAALTGTGSLEKLGAGVLTLANGTRTVGATTINGGGLVLSASSTLNATSAVANSGTITIGQGSSLVVSGSTPIFQNTPSLFVSNADFFSPSISVFNLQNSQFLRSISGNMSTPNGVAVDSSGNIYVANRSANTISKFSSNGTFLNSITGNMNGPTGLAFDGSGNIYVTNQSNNTLSKFSSNGTFLSSISGNMSSPTGVAFDGSGNIYVASRSDNTVSKFSSNGTFLGPISGNMSSPVGIAFDGGGNLYVTNYSGASGDTVSKFSSNGTFLGPISGNMSSPVGVAFDGGGNLYVTNISGASGNTVSKFSSNGTFLSSISGNLSSPYALAIGNYTTTNGSTPNGLTLAASANDTATLNLGTYGGSDTTATLTTPFIAFGNGTAAFNLNLAGNTTVSADLIGGNSNSTINQLGTGTTTLTSANSTYAGGVNVNAGTLQMGASLANSSFTVNGGTLAGGNITIGDVVINSGGTIAPGNSPGTLTTGNMTWNGGGTYNWELGAANGTAGTGWDLISSNGSLTIGANSTNRFTIAASTSNASGFNPNLKNASWKIAEFAGGISGFDPMAFTINATGFANLPSMYAFGITKNGTALNFSYATVATWIGGTGNWTNTANWEAGFAAINGVAVDYAGSNGTSSNDSSVGNIGGLTFTNNSSGSFTLAGGDLAIGSGGITNNSSYTNTVAMNLVLGANQTFAANTANLIVSGNISGNASLTKAGNKTLTLSGANTYTGETTIAAGTVAISSTGSLTGTSKIFVGNSTSGNTLNILGAASTGNMTLSHQVGSNDNTVTVGGGTAPASLTVANLINVGFGGTGNTLDILDNGTVTAASTWIGGYGANNTINLTGGVLNSTTDIVVGYFADGNALSITAGGNATAGSIIAGLDAGSANNTILVSGSSSALQTSGLIYLGQNGTSNSLVVENGGKVHSQNQNVAIGFNAGSNNNALTINGTGSHFSNNNTLYVGNAGSTNSLTVSNGGNLTTANSRIGAELTSANNTATVSGAGSIWTNTGTLRVGSNGTANSLAIANGGQMNSVGDMFLGYDAGSANNLLSVNGTGSKLVGANLTVGYGGSSNNLLVQNGGNLTLTQGLGIGYDAAAANNTATVTGTGSTLRAQNIQIGNGADNKLIVADSATVSAANIALAGTNATLQIGDGAAAGNLALSGSILTTGAVTGRSVIFNHTDAAYEFASAMSGDLALAQNGTGNTSLTANNSHTGGTTISAGTLSIGNGSTSGSITGNITNNASLVFNRSNNSTYSGAITGTGTLQKLGTGTTTLNGSNTYAGGTTVSAGTLVLASGGSISHSGAGFYLGGAGENAAMILNGGSISNFDGYIGFGNGSIATVNMSSGNWTNGENLRVGYYGNGTLNLTGGSISNVNGVIGRYGDSNGVANVSGGTWSSSGNLRIGQEATGTLNLTGGNVVVASGTGNVTIGQETGSSGILNIGTGTTVGTLQAARVTGGNGSSVVNFNHSGNQTFSPILAGSLAVNKLGNGTTILTGNNTYTGGTTVSAGTLEGNSQSLQGAISNDASVVFNEFTNGTYAGIMSGNGTLSKTGNGALTLSGNNTFTGGTTIDAGTLIASRIVGDVTNYASFVVETGGTAGAVTNYFGAAGSNNGTVASLSNLGTFTSGGNITGDILSFGSSVTIRQGGVVSGNSTIGAGEFVVAGAVADVSNNAIMRVESGGTVGEITNLGNATTTNNGTVASLLSSGAFTNSGNIMDSVISFGTLESSGAIGGSLIVGGGVTTINGTVAGATTVTVAETAGVLQGTGTLGELEIRSGGTVAPGTVGTIGNLTAGNMTWNSGGVYNWQTSSLNGAGTPGSAWDLISSNGSLIINASANSTVGIRVTSLGGNLTNDIKKAEWEIGNFDGGIAGYNKSFFSVNATGLGARGRFFVTAEEHSLMLNYKTAAVWLGGNGNWTTAALWEDNYIAVNGDEVEFSGNGGTSTNNNVNSVASLTFTSIASGSYTLNGNALAVGAAGIVNDSEFEQTIAMDLTANGTLSVNAASGNLVLSGIFSGASSLTKNGSQTLTLTGNNAYTAGTLVSAGTLAGTTAGLQGAITNNAVVNFDQNFTGTYAGVMSGTGSLIKSGAGAVLLSGNNSYSGGTTINSGVLAAAVETYVSGNKVVTLNPNAFGNGSVTINAGGAIRVPSTTSSGAHLTIKGNLALNNGAIAFYDIGDSPLDQDLRIDVRGSFSAAAGTNTFDFSEVQALSYGNYTLVNATAGVSAPSANFVAVHGPYTTLFGNFTTSNNTVVYTVTGAVSGGSDIQNNGGPNTPVVANYNITGPTVTKGENNQVNALTFSSSAPLAIQSNGELTVTSGTLAVQTGSSVVSGGTLVAPEGLNKDGTGELDFTNNVVVTGTAAVNAGLLSVNGQLQTTGGVVVNPNATLGGAGLIVGNVNVNGGNISPGNSPGTLSVAGNLVLTGANATLIEIASPTNFDRIVVSGTATLGGTLNAVAYGGGTITPGARYDFLQAGNIVGEYSSLIAPEGLRIRFLNSGTVGTLLFGPESFVPYALNQNQINVAKALDIFVLATEGDSIVVGTALDSLTTEQFPAAFDQIMPGFYESLANIAIEQAFAQTQMLNQRISSVRLGAAGFQAIGGITQPLVHDKNGKSAADAKDASPIVESATATNWNAWALGTGMFSRSTDLGRLQNYNNDAGGFLVGADYRWSENFVTGLYGGYDYSYAEYNGGGSTKGNSFSFGTYASYAKDGYYADAVIGGGYTGFQTQRSIEFSTIDRTASADPNSGQFTAGINLGKDFEVGKFTLGPIVGAQYTYAGIGSFTESGAESLDLSLGQQNANSLRSTLGGRIAYTWNLNQKIALIPEVRMFWQHEFLNNPRTINASLDGGNGASFDYETTDPYRNSVFAGAGVTAQFGKNLSGSVFYNINFGSQTYQSNMISAGLNFSF